jgi:hypothetical protein
MSQINSSSDIVLNPTTFSTYTEDSNTNTNNNTGNSNQGSSGGINNNRPITDFSRSSLEPTVIITNMNDMNSTNDNNTNINSTTNNNATPGTDVTGMMKTMNYPNSNNIQNRTNMNANTNANTNTNTNTNMNMNMNTNISAAAMNNFSVNEFMKLQQQLNASNINTNNPQNSMNPALMVAQNRQNQHQHQHQQLQLQQQQQLQQQLLQLQQQLQYQHNNNNNNRIPQTQFSGGMTSGQVNSYQNNPIYGQLMMANQQQNGIGRMIGNNVMNAGGGAGVGSLAGRTHATPAAQQQEINVFQQFQSHNALFFPGGNRRMRGGVIEPFPEKLHRLLVEVEAAGRADVISFVANGRAFAIHKAGNFFKEIVPLYFRQSRLSSFKRQLNLYGFELINTGPARGGYYHELFVKERPELCRRMRRVAVKATPVPAARNNNDNKNRSISISSDNSNINSNNNNNNEGDGGDDISTKHVPIADNIEANRDIIIAPRTEVGSEEESNGKT